MKDKFKKEFKQAMKPIYIVWLVLSWFIILIVAIHPKGNINEPYCAKKCIDRGYLYSEVLTDGWNWKCKCDNN